MPTLRVLIAEDNRINQKILKELVRKEGFQATAVANGKEALQQLEQQEFDLLILDFHMPELNGLDTLKAIRSHTHTGIRSVKVALFTAEKDNRQMQDIQSLGVDYLLQKPVNLAQFSEVIKQTNSCFMAGGVAKTCTSMEYLQGITSGNCM